MTEQRAHRRARYLSRKNRDTEFYIVHEDGFDVCTDYDLHTFYLGLHEDQIRAVYLGGRCVG